MPRVSVIVPAYNAEEHIGEALASVVAQTYGDWEAIVADDASTDATAERASGVDPRIRVVRAAANAGPAPTRNLAIEHAEGELLAFLDADDAWLPEFLDAQVGLYDREVAAGRRIGIVSCDARVIDSDGAELGTHLGRAGIPPRGPVTLTQLLDGNVIYVSALAPRAVVEEVGEFSPETRGSEDHDLWIRIVEAGYEVASNPQVLAVYREAEGSVSSSALGMARTNIATYRRALERGRLTPAQRRLARRSLRLHEAIGKVEAVMAKRTAGGRLGAGDLATAARAGATFGWFALRHPSRWRRWARTLARGSRAPWRPPRGS